LVSINISFWTNYSKSALGSAELDELLSERERVNKKVQEIINRQTESWGVEVPLVEIKEIALPETMRRALARQAEAERERRAKIIDANGEYQTAEIIKKAAETINSDPLALQLRYLQTLREIAIEKNTTILFPFPIDLLAPFIKDMEKKRKVVIYLSYYKKLQLFKNFFFFPTQLITIFQKYYLVFGVFPSSPNACVVASFGFLIFFLLIL
jgi:hypothetical protein